MQLVEFNARKHYAEIRSWWSNQAWSGIDLDLLPKNGFVVEVGEQMLCAGFLYSTDSGFAWLEWLIGNPQVSWQERGLGLDLLIQGAINKARELNFKVILISTQNQRLLDRLMTKHDFTLGDASVTNLIRRI